MGQEDSGGERTGCSPITVGADKAIVTDDPTDRQIQSASQFHLEVKGTEVRPAGLQVMVGRDAGRHPVGLKLGL
jgi:hypothetical protein